MPTDIDTGERRVIEAYYDIPDRAGVTQVMKTEAHVIERQFFVVTIEERTNPQGQPLPPERVRTPIELGDPVEPGATIEFDDTDSDKWVTISTAFTLSGEDTWEPGTPPPDFPEQYRIPDKQTAIARIQQIMTNCDARAFESIQRYATLNAARRAKLEELFDDATEKAALDAEHTQRRIAWELEDATQKPV